MEYTDNTRGIILIMIVIILLKLGFLSFHHTIFRFIWHFVSHIVQDVFAFVEFVFYEPKTNLDFAGHRTDRGTIDSAITHHSLTLKHNHENKSFRLDEKQKRLTKSMTSSIPHSQSLMSKLLKNTFGDVGEFMSIFGRKAHGMLMQKYEQFGPVYTFSAFGQKMVFLFEVEDIDKLKAVEGKCPRHVDFKHLRKHREDRGYPKGLLVSNDEEWYRQRKILSNPMMLKIGHHVEIIDELVEQTISRTLTDFTSNGSAQIEVEQITKDYAINAFGTILYGDTFDCTFTENGKIMKTFAEMAKNNFEDAKTLLMTPEWMMTMHPAWKRHNTRWNFLLKTTMDIIERCTKDKNDDCILSCLLHGGKLNDKEIFINLTDLLVASIDTTNTTLQWCLYELACHPNVQGKILKEANTMLQGRSHIEKADLEKLVYLKAVVWESLRLHPVGFFTSRIIQDEMVVKGIKIPSNTNVAISMYVMARNPRLFPEPDCFMPDRWLTNNPKIKKLPHDVFFGFGPRMCLGSLELVTPWACPNLWDRYDRSYSNFRFCVRRLPEPVTWYDGEKMCKDWIGMPLSWNETLLQTTRGDFDIDEPEIWSSLKVMNGKFAHSGAPQTIIGVFPFAPPGQTPIMEWKSNQPNLQNGECVSTTKNRTAEMSQCSEKKFMYCQRHQVQSVVGTVDTYCPTGYIGNLKWSKCYKYINNATTFQQASADCQQNGARLYSIDGALIDSGSDFPAAEFNLLRASNRYFYDVVNSNASNQTSSLRFWYTDATQTGKCGIISYSEGFTSNQITDDCGSKIPYVCETDVQVPIDRDMKVTIGFVMLTKRSEVPTPYTQCNLSRELLPGETINIKINNIPLESSQITLASRDSLLYYIGDVFDFDIYPIARRNGYHRCEVRGVHNKQIWTASTYNQMPDDVMFLGSVDISPSLPDAEVLKFNLATAPETSIPQGRTSPGYELQQEWLNMIRNLNVFSGDNNRLNGYYSSVVNSFRNNGSTIDFQIVMDLYSNYSMVGEQNTRKFVSNYLIQEMNKKLDGNRKRRNVVYNFIPSSLNVISTLTCAGDYYYSEWDVDVTFPVVPFGSAAESSDICITDKKPLATAYCTGGTGRAATLTNIVVNPECVFKDLTTSPVTEDLKNLATVDVNSRNIGTVVDTLKNITTDPVILTSVDVILIADILTKTTNLTSIEEEVVIDILSIIDNITDIDLDKLQEAQTDGSATNRLLEVINSVSRTVVLVNKTSIQYTGRNIYMGVYEVSSMSSPVIGIQVEGQESIVLTEVTIETLMTNSNITVNLIDAAIILPVQLVNKMNNSTRVSLNTYRDLDLFYVRPNVRQYLPNSRVIAASLTVDGNPVYFLREYQVQTVFFPRMEKDEVVCGYWDFDRFDTSGGWATDGCQLNKTEYGRHVCVCDHLTNFAVLVNIGGQETLDDSLAINIISWIGLILSIVGLSLTVLTFIIFRHLRKGRAQQTLFNLALSLLCFLIVFIVGIEQTSNYGGCIAVAVLLHYFILVAFMWMLMEGILQYLRFVKVLGTYIPNFILKTAVPAWGIPLIPVIIVLAIDHHMYHGGTKACWMSLTTFYYAFVIPVGIIIAANIIIFIMILKNLLGRPKGLQSNQSERKRAMMNFRAALSVFVLLGLTWLFGFFTIEAASTVFQYIFTILNVFQGFLIFLLFTAREKKVRQSWQKMCCKQKTKDKYAKCDSSSGQNKYKINSSTSDDQSKSTGMDRSSSSTQ